MTATSTAGLASLLQAGGHLADDWVEAFTAVDRGGFIPDRIWLRADGGYQPVDRVVDPQRWQAAVYGDTPVVTQVEDPDRDPALVPSSSASMPRMVASMLAQLDVRDGHRVLEVGTGTGYNAALLCAQLGDDQVTSVEIDPGLATAARSSLAAAGWKPTVVTGDGADGWAAGAPYDRVVVTCALATVPYPLIAQTAPGGLLVTPWGTGLYNGVVARLRVHDSPGGPIARGPVVGDSAFMWMRQQAPADRDVMHGVHGTGKARHTTLDPRYVLGDENAAFAIGAQHPRVRYTVGHGDGGQFTLWLTHPDGSWASVDYVPGQPEFEVQEHGERRLWDDVQTAYGRWRGAGSPDRTRHGLTVTEHDQRVWLDEPGNELARFD